MPSETNGKYSARAPRGFCAGVVRAVDIVELASKLTAIPSTSTRNCPQYYVVEQLRRRGAIFVETIEEFLTVPFSFSSAHGVPPPPRRSKARSLKGHRQRVRSSPRSISKRSNFAREDRTIILIGHKDHQEIIGTSGERPTVHRVDSVEAVDRLEVNNPEKLAFHANHARLYDTRKSSPAPPEVSEIVGPKSDDICYATQNRQDAVEQVAREMDLILVVGSQNQLQFESPRRSRRAPWRESHAHRFARISIPPGSQVLKELVLRQAPPLPKFWSNRSASAPEHGFTDQRDLDLIREDVRFTLPRNWQPSRLLRAAEAPKEFL